MNSYDAWKDGRFNPESPINQIETDAEIVKGWDNLTEAYESGHEHVFHEKRNEIVNDLWVVLEVLKATDNGLKNRVLNIIEKMM
jgi:hypothetical protein